MCPCKLPGALPLLSEGVLGLVRLCKRYRAEEQWPQCDCSALPACHRVEFPAQQVKQSRLSKRRIQHIAWTRLDKGAVVPLFCRGGSQTEHALGQLVRHVLATLTDLAWRLGSLDRLYRQGYFSRTTVLWLRALQLQTAVGLYTSARHFHDTDPQAHWVCRNLDIVAAMHVAATESQQSPPNRRCTVKSQ